MTLVAKLTRELIIDFILFKRFSLRSDPVGENYFLKLHTRFLACLELIERLEG